MFVFRLKFTEYVEAQLGELCYQFTLCVNVCICPIQLVWASPIEVSFAANEVEVLAPPIDVEAQLGELCSPSMGEAHTS